MVFWTGAALVLAIGCNGGANKPAAPTTSAAESAEREHERLERAMASIEHIFDFHRLGRTTSVEDGVARLNDWQRAFESTEQTAIAPLPPDLQKLLTPGQLQALDQPRFTLRDGEHLRDCLLARAVSTFGVGIAENELDKVSNLFGHIMRAIGLVSQPLQDLPLVPYEFYLFGKGTAEERAWMFASVLRQLKIDAVLLFPKNADESATPGADRRPFLVGVLLDDKIYLFDPANGVAIPSRQAGTARPATLAEAVADPSVLEQLDADKNHVYPLRAGDLRKPAVAIVGDPCFWSPRMQSLQTQFVGARSLTIADPLQDSADGMPGLWSRIVKAGGEHWGAADVKLWEYPEAQLSAHGEMNQLERASLTGLLRPFSAYLHIRVNPAGQSELVEHEEVADPAGGEFDPGIRTQRRMTKGEQMRARLFQLSGDFAQAIEVYTDVRVECRKIVEVGPLAERTMHARAVDDATYWTALCKYEQGKFQGAADDLRKYRKAPASGAWQRESRYLLALSLAAAGKKAEATRTLEAVEPDDPAYAGFRLLIRQWQGEAAPGGESNAGR